MPAFTKDDLEVIATFKLGEFFELEEDHIYHPSGDKLMKDEVGYTLLLIGDHVERTRFDDLHTALEKFDNPESGD